MQQSVGTMVGVDMDAKHADYSALKSRLMIDDFGSYERLRERYRLVAEHENARRRREAGPVSLRKKGENWVVRKGRSALLGLYGDRQCALSAAKDEAARFKVALRVYRLDGTLLKQYVPVPGRRAVR